MADGRHLEKNEHGHIRNALTDLHKIWQDDAFWPSEGYGQLKFPTFENPRFHVDRLRGFWTAGPPKVPFPILI